MAPVSRSRIVLVFLGVLFGHLAVLSVLLGVSPTIDVVEDEVGFGSAPAPTPPLPTIDPHTPLADLLPTAPKVNAPPVYLGKDLASVPELMIEAQPAETLTTEQWKSRKALAMAVALHLNCKEEDGFLKELLLARPDLAGVPFLMGDACRTKGDRKAAFKWASAVARRQQQGCVEEGEPLPLAADPGFSQGEEKRQQFWLAQAAVAAQIMPAENTRDQALLIRALAAIPHPEATRQLARVAVFAPQATDRARAIEVLSVRRPSDSTAVLVAGLCYPWPAAAKNAAQAIVKLDRKDLAGHLKAMLDEPDPRGPRTEAVAGRTVTVAHELVRINHLRNCMLCHAPVERGKEPEETLVAETPVPSEPLPNDYEPKSNLLVRIDVTYLRQDFSVLQAVKEKSAWPARQRFDFVVRKRLLTPAEAADLRARLAKRAPGDLSPYHRAAAEALRALMDRDARARANAERRQTSG